MPSNQLHDHIKELIVAEIIVAAKAVTWFDWSGNDHDATQAIQQLSDAIARYELLTPRL